MRYIILYIFSAHQYKFLGKLFTKKYTNFKFYKVGTVRQTMEIVVAYTALCNSNAWSKLI